MSKVSLKIFRSRQQIKDDQINYLLGDLEKSLQEYKFALDAKEKQLSDARKILLSAKQSYDNVVKENTDLKWYIEKLKQHFQQQQLQFLKEQKNYQEFPKKYKKVIYQEETESEPEFEEEKENEIESKQIEKNKNKIKKAFSKRKNTNIYDFINKKCREK